MLVSENNEWLLIFAQHFVNIQWSSEAGPANLIGFSWKHFRCDSILIHCHFTLFTLGITLQFTVCTYNFAVYTFNFAVYCTLCTFNFTAVCTLYAAFCSLQLGLAAPPPPHPVDEWPYSGDMLHIIACIYYKYKYVQIQIQIQICTDTNTNTNTVEMSCIL